MEQTPHKKAPYGKHIVKAYRNENIGLFKVQYKRLIRCRKFSLLKQFMSISAKYSTDWMRIQNPVKHLK